MLYSYEITVTKDTTEAAPEVTIAKLIAGTITKVSFRPRPGHNGLCHVRVLEHLHQLWPTNPDDSLHGDTFPIEWEENHELTEVPYELTVRAWNEDDTYDHTFDISFAVLPPGSTLAAALSNAIANILSIFSPRRIFGGS